MKPITAKILSVLFLFNNLSCHNIETTQEINSPIDSTNQITTASLSKTDHEIQENINNYRLQIYYDKTTNFNLNDLQISKIINWGKRFKKDSLFFPNKKLTGEFIIEMNAILSIDIHRDIATKRMDELEKKLNKVLGQNLNGRIPLYKTIKSLRYSTEDDNYVLLTVNRLMY